MEFRPFIWDVCYHWFEGQSDWPSDQLRISLLMINTVSTQIWRSPWAVQSHLGGTVVKRPPLSRAIPAGHGFDALASRFAGIFLAFFPIGFSKVLQGVDG